MSFKLTIGLSKRRKLPVFYVLSWSIAPYKVDKLLEVLWEFRDFKEIESNEEYTVLWYKGNFLKILNDSFYLPTMLNEWRIWKKYYIPPFSIKGKTVLDVGAGCGETAFLFFLYGAKKVIAVEPNKKAVKCLEENAERNNWNVEIIPEKFSIKHLELDFDFMKMDIEGDEKLLLNSPKIKKPSIVEVHGVGLLEKFLKTGWFRIYSSSKDNHLCTNFKWKLKE